MLKPNQAAIPAMSIVLNLQHIEYYTWINLKNFIEGFGFVSIDKSIMSGIKAAWASLSAQFYCWAIQRVTEHSFFLLIVMFSDGVGYFDYKTCRIRRMENHTYEEIPLHPEGVTMLCAIQLYGTIVPYFSRNEQEQIVTANAIFIGQCRTIISFQL